jgi:transcriptional regulator with XRE-family HTH domain
MRSPSFARPVPWDSTISIVIRVSSEMTRFGEKLRAWRKSARVSQASLERTIGRARGWVSSHEKGATKPPDKATCQQIAHALGLADQVVWTAARAERLRGFDEDLWRWYEEIERQTPSTSSEVSSEMSDHQNDVNNLLKRLESEEPKDFEEPWTGTVTGKVHPTRYVTIKEFTLMVMHLHAKIDANIKEEESRVTRVFQDCVYNQKRNALVMQGRWAPPPLEKRKSDDAE